MAAYEEKVLVDEEAEQRQCSIMEEYKQKLIVCGNVMPHPFSLKDGGKKRNRFGKMLISLLMNIEKFLCQINKSSDMLLRLESDYKEGKAYTYYKCEFLKKYFTTMCLLNQNTAF